MYRIVYTSTSKTLMSERDLQSVLRSARRRNAADQITGMLIYHDGCFFQVLEGPRQVVEKCYKRIQKDQRHQDHITLSNEDVVSRLFNDWWMSYRSIDDLGAVQKAQFVNLKQLAKQVKESDLTSDLKTNAILLAFLSTFRDLDMVG